MQRADSADAGRALRTRMYIEPIRRVLVALGVRYALIGAHAMAARGSPRFTFDVDLLAGDPRVLDAAILADLAGACAEVGARRCAAVDRLGGVVRILLPDGAEVDLILAKWKCGADLIARAEGMGMGRAPIRVARVGVLIVLELAAGGRGFAGRRRATCARGSLRRRLRNCSAHCGRACGHPGRLERPSGRSGSLSLTTRVERQDYSGGVTIAAAMKIGAALPDVEQTTSWGAPSLKARGKMMACQAINKAVEPNTLVVCMSIPERDELIAADPNTYYLKPHSELSVCPSAPVADPVRRPRAICCGWDGSSPARRPTGSLRCAGRRHRSGGRGRRQNGISESA